MDGKTDLGPRPGAERHCPRGPGPGRSPRSRRIAPRVYPTQPFEVTLRVLVRPLPDDADRDPLDAAPPPPPAPRGQLGRPAGRPDRRRQGTLAPETPRRGRRGFTLNDFTTRSISFFEGPRRRRSSTCTRGARAGRGSTASRSITSSTSSNASSRPRRPGRTRSARRS